MCYNLNSLLPSLHRRNISSLPIACFTDFVIRACSWAAQIKLCVSRFSSPGFHQYNLLSSVLQFPSGIANVRLSPSNSTAFLSFVVLYFLALPLFLGFVLSSFAFSYIFLLAAFKLIRAHYEFISLILPGPHSLSHSLSSYHPYSLLLL